MGITTTDDKNLGRRQIEQFSVGAGLAHNEGDHVDSFSGNTKKPVKFLLLKNCLVDKRLGVLLKRPGSTTETITSSLGVPMGIHEYTSGAQGTIPINRTLLFNFGGNSFYSQQAGTYTAVSKSSRCSFSTSRQSQACKIGDVMTIAGGLPARWKGPGKTIERVGIVPPTDVIQIFSNNGTGSGNITLTTGSKWMYTFYDSSTGLESDWSPITDFYGDVTDASINLTIPTITAANWDKIKIYRTLDGGEIPYFVAMVPSGTTSYVDNIAEEDLTEVAEDRYERAVPPSTSFITATFAQCVWLVDGSNPYRLVFSMPYIGSNNDVEYYPVDNYVITNEPITGLLVVPGKLLVFHPRSISYISGFSVDDFAIQPFSPGTGTVFPNSVSTNGIRIVFLAEQGFVSIPSQGGEPEYISREIDLDLQPLLAGSYNSAVYASSCWNPSLRQFVFMINAQSAAGAPWEEVGTGSTATAVAGWETPSPGSITDVWEDVANPNATYANNVRIWGWSPELSGSGRNMWMEYEFPTITNGNVIGAYPTVLFHPQPSSDTSDPQQDKTYLGYWSATQGEIRTIFRRDKSQDDSTNITSEWITERLIPGEQNGGYKIYHALGFQNSYSDPTYDSNCTLKYLIDYDDPQIRSYSGSLVTITSSSTDIKKFPTMLGRHIHLYGTDTSTSLSKVLLGEFFIHFRERFRRQER